jgi:hypothetical protein
MQAHTHALMHVHTHAHTCTRVCTRMHMHTLREEIASCSEKAYERLRLVDAQKMLFFASEAETRSYAEQVRLWAARTGIIC